MMNGKKDSAIAFGITLVSSRQSKSKNTDRSRMIST